MGVQTTISALHTLLTSLQNPQLKQILSIIGHETQLDDLQIIVTTMHAMLRDAGTNLHDSHVAPNWIEALKDPVYKANVQLEKFISVTGEKLLLKSDGDGSITLSEKLRFFYYRLNPLGVPYRVSQVVNNIRRVLDAYTKYCGDVDFYVKDLAYVSESSRWSRDAIYYYVVKGEIIGRENDLDSIIGMLLDSSNERDVSFLSIAGVAGLGKSTLAQHVYHDSRIKEAFSLRMWVFVSDHGQRKLNVKFILDKILRSATCEDHEVSTMDQVQSLIRQQLLGKRYLLVLDDVWTEKPGQLHRLTNCLIGGQKGSWIIVTTRSRRTATTLQDGQLYELQGLSEENSWKLFQKIALPEPNESNNKDVIEIGQGIVAGCAQNPLAIKVAGYILHDQGREEWKMFRDIGFANIKRNDIISILRPSYNSLESPLKSCFIYCALFPKDFTINKDMLISLWMAQDYIEPLNIGVSTEDVGDQYFSTFLDKYFFKDIQRDKYGEILSCKLQDIILVLAQHVADKEMYTMSDFQNILDERVHHVSFVDGKQIGCGVLGNTNILSYLHVGYNNVHFCNVTKSSLVLLLAKCRSLKALDLGGLLYESLPDSIGELSLLRYLNLSGNTEIKVLPRTITRLYNLQTLNLQKCHKLKELPKDFNRLVKLRMLNIWGCSTLTCMPRGIGKLTCLHKLSDFTVSDEGSYTSWKQMFDALEDLKPLDNLRGHLNIEIRCPNVKYAASKDARREILYPLKSKGRLKAVEYDFKHVEVDGVLDIEGVTRLMKELQPPSNLQYIKLWRYQGVRIDWDTFPSNLVQLVLVGCSELECLPCLRYLRHLKVLHLLKLKKLEYIGQDGSLTNSRSYYPSLDTLWLENLPKLKGWRMGSADDHVCQILYDKGSSSSDNKAQRQLLLCFSQLKSLFIWNCPQLTWIPFCPTVEDLKLVNFNSTLRIIKSTESDDKLDVASTSASRIDIPCCSSRSYIQNRKNIKKTKKMALSNVAWLNSEPVEAFKHLENLEIWCDKEVESLGEVEEVFRGCSSSLRILIIHNCSNLKNVVPGGLKHLTALEKLELRNCDNLTLSEEQGEQEENEDSIAIGLIKWSLNLQLLHTLKLDGLPQLVNLPDWMQFLPSLQCLCISYCNKIKSLPDWMPKITSLRQIIVHGCSVRLERRCREYEEDWPSIQFRFHNCVF